MLPRNENLTVESLRDDMLSYCQQFQVQRLFLIGSAATGEFDPNHSDLDFLVTFAPAEPVDKADRNFDLLFALEDHYGRSIDLVEENAITNLVFKESLERSRIQLYAA